jgi:FkbM family methyltransferase
MQNSYFDTLTKTILNFEKPILLDIGAASGLQPHWSKLLGNSQIIFFEPHQESYEELIKIYSQSPYMADLKFKNYGLSYAGGKRDFYKTNCPTGSSLYEPDQNSMYVNDKDPYFFPVTKLTIDTKSLKQCLEEDGIEKIDGMKLDIQGSELEVIKGLDKNRIDNCLLIESEVALVNIYKNGTTFTDLKDYLENNNFELFDIKSNRAPLRIPGSLNYYCDEYLKVDYHCPAVSSRIYELDAVFFKNTKYILSQNCPKQVRKACFLFCIYNFFSEALNILELAQSQKILSNTETQSIGQAVVNWHLMVRNELKDLENKFAQSNNLVWSQYTWVPYPCS